MVEMATEHHTSKVAFKTITLHKDQIIGIGAFGTVCKAKCDGLLCAAKIIHPTLFDPTGLHKSQPGKQHRLPMRRFERECEFLNAIQHPNIIQYLGIYRDPDTALPVLLMELMDDSLTHFLESSPLPIPYHIQVNICHDITRALSFLHANNIIHKNLSSNNVLLIGTRAKVTDFEITRLGDPLHSIFPMPPGTVVYMPPEAIQVNPRYTDKIDCFSFGVIVVQILTQKFPKPGDRLLKVKNPQGPEISIAIPEIQRRQNDIHRIDPSDSLLPIALDCLHDRDTDRPSAAQLCERIGDLKGTVKYESAHKRISKDTGIEKFQQQVRELDQYRQRMGELEYLLKDRDQELRQQVRELDQHRQRVSELEYLLKDRDQELQHLVRELHQVLQAKMEDSEKLTERIEKLEKERDQLIQEINKKEGYVTQINKQLVESEQLIAKCHDQIAESEQERHDQVLTEKLEKERLLRRVNQQLKESEQLIAEFDRRTKQTLENIATVAQKAQAKIREKATEDLKHQLTIQELASLNLQKEDLKESIGLPGVDVCAETTVIITNNPQTFIWENFGLKLHIPKGCLPERVKQCTINIKASLAGHYEFPKHSILVSGIFWLRCEPRCRFNVPVSIEVEHCGASENTSKLAFVKALCSQKNLPYTFTEIGGQFNEKSSYGILELSSFSGLAILLRGSRGREYIARLFYLNQTAYMYEIHMVVTWNIRLHHAVVEEKYSQEKQVSIGPEQLIQFEAAEIKLDIPKDGTTLKEGWKILPLIAPVISKRNVDKFEPGKMIPKCQLSADFIKPIEDGKVPMLLHHVNLIGAKEPYNTFVIKPPLRAIEPPSATPVTAGLMDTKLDHHVHFQVCSYG